MIKRFISYYKPHKKMFILDMVQTKKQMQGVLTASALII